MRPDMSDFRGFERGFHFIGVDEILSAVAALCFTELEVIRIRGFSGAAIHRREAALRWADCARRTTQKGQLGARNGRHRHNRKRPCRYDRTSGKDYQPSCRRSGKAEANCQLWSGWPVFERRRCERAWRLAFQMLRWLFANLALSRLVALVVFALKCAVREVPEIACDTIANRVTVAELIGLCVHNQFTDCEACEPPLGGSQAPCN